MQKIKNNNVRVADFQNDTKVYPYMTLEDNLFFFRYQAISHCGFMNLKEMKAVGRLFREQYKEFTDFRFDMDALSYPEKIAIYMERLKISHWDFLLCRNIEGRMTMDLEPIIKRQFREMVSKERSILIIAESPEHFMDVADGFLIACEDGSIQRFTGEEIKNNFN